MLHPISSKYGLTPEQLKQNANEREIRMRRSMLHIPPPSKFVILYRDGEFRQKRDCRHLLETRVERKQLLYEEIVAVPIENGGPIIPVKEYFSLETDDDDFQNIDLSRFATRTAFYDNGCKAFQSQLHWKMLYEQERTVDGVYSPICTDIVTLLGPQEFETVDTPCLSIDLEFLTDMLGTDYYMSIKFDGIRGRMQVTETQLVCIFADAKSCTFSNIGIPQIYRGLMFAIERIDDAQNDDIQHLILFDVCINATFQHRRAILVRFHEYLLDHVITLSIRLHLQTCTKDVKRFREIVVAENTLPFDGVIISFDHQVAQFKIKLVETVDLLYSNGKWYALGTNGNNFALCRVDDKIPKNNGSVYECILCLKQGGTMVSIKAKRQRFDKFQPNSIGIFIDYCKRILKLY